MTDQPLAISAQAHSEQKGWRRNQDLVDALPYIDGLTAEEKQRVDALIEEEMRHSDKKPADYLADLPPQPTSLLPDHQLLQSDLERIAAGTKLNAMDVDRYNLNPPAAAQRSDPSAWQTALENAYAQLEHQHNRLVNLELMLKFGPDVWRAHNEELAAQVKRLQAELADTRQKTDDVNRERKLQQVVAGKELQALEHDYMGLVLKNADIDLACRQLEEQLEKQQKQQ